MFFTSLSDPTKSFILSWHSLPDLELIINMKYYFLWFELVLLNPLVSTCFCLLTTLA
jgi:hypothetical protein